MCECDVTTHKTSWIVSLFSFLRWCLKCELACHDHQTLYRMMCHVYFHLLLPGNTRLYICTRVLWRVGGLWHHGFTLWSDFMTIYIFYAPLHRFFFLNKRVNLSAHTYFNIHPFPLTYFNRRPELAISQASHVNLKFFKKREATFIYLDNPALCFKQPACYFWFLIFFFFRRGRSFSQLSHTNLCRD